MSFESKLKKPRLVEGKLVKYYNEKYKQKELKIEENVKLRQEMEIINNQPSWYKKFCNICWDFIKENYGFFIIITLITILLYVRFIEVNKRKQKMKKIIDKINKDDQSINHETNEDENDY